MKLLTTILLVGSAYGLMAQDRMVNTVILDEVAEANLGIETVAAEEGGFEELVFALGEVRHTCSSHSVVSSRIAGRVIEVLEFEGHTVEKGDVVAKIESLQPGDPPPVIELTAPASGVIVDSKIHLGAPVEPSVELMEILDLSSVWVVANDQQVEIISGLYPGDEVVTRGTYSLAFSGGGGTSLKEALDAAHGYPHNEDGTEMTKEEIASANSGGNGDGTITARSTMTRTGQGEIQSVLRAREIRLQLAGAKLDALREFHLARVRHETALGNP